MGKNNNKNLIELLTKFQAIIANKPSKEEMFEELQMMNFKIKPLQGDVTILDLKDSRFIEVLWGLGKLEEFFHKEVDRISPTQRPLAFKIFQDLSQKFQEQLNKINLRSEKQIDKPQVLEVEIIKEKLLRKPN